MKEKIRTQQELLTAFGDRVRKIRLSKDLTQSQLASICNFENSTMSKIEAGKVNVSYYTLYRLSIGLNVHVCSLTVDH